MTTKSKYTEWINTAQQFDREVLEAERLGQWEKAADLREQALKARLIAQSFLVVMK